MYMLLQCIKYTNLNKLRSNKIFYFSLKKKEPMCSLVGEQEMFNCNSNGDTNTFHTSVCRSIVIRSFVIKLVHTSEGSTDNDLLTL